MTDKFQNKYRIESTRKPNWDYSSSGWYFITICTNYKECYFGEIYDKEMHLNELGNVAHNELLKTSTIRKNIKLGEFVVMPNHIHAIIIIDSPRNVETRRGASLQSRFGPLISQSLGSVINHFKGSVTKYANEKQISFQWQSRYHDRIIRNEFEYSAKVEYILNNPARWEEDRNNPKNINLPRRGG